MHQFVIEEIGSTGIIVEIFIEDTSNPGEGLTGLVFNTAGLVATYYRNDDPSTVAITLVNMSTLGTWVDSGFRELDSTNFPGWYCLALPNSATSAGTTSVVVSLFGAANMLPTFLKVNLSPAMSLTSDVINTITAQTSVDVWDSVFSPIIENRDAVGNSSTEVEWDAAPGTYPDDFFNGLTALILFSGDLQQVNIIEDYDDSSSLFTLSQPLVFDFEDVIGIVIYSYGGPNSGAADVNVISWDGTPVATPHTAGYPVVTIKDGAGTGELNTDNGQVIVGTNNDKTDYVLSNADKATLVDNIWDEDVVSAHSTAGTSGLIISELTKRTVTINTAVADGSIIGQILDDGTDVYDRTTDSLSEIRDNSTVVPAATIADAVWDELRAGHVISGSFGENVLADIITDGIDTGAISTNALGDIGGSVWEELTSDHTTESTFGSMLQPILVGTLDSATSTEVVFALSASGTDDFFNNQLLVIIDGTGIGQARLITDYVGATRTATVGEAFTVIPDNTSRFVVHPFVSDTDAVAADVADAVWDELRSGHTTVGSFGEGITSVQGDVTGNVGGDVLGNVNVTISSLGAGAITSSTFATDAIDSNALASSAVDKIWDAVIESTLSFKNALRLMLSSLAGKSSGGGTTSVKFRDIADSKDRITATVDANGNRTSVTRDGS